MGKVFSDILTPNWLDFIDGIKSIPNYGISAFGPGWGLILTLASFNKFNTNIRYTSWLIGGGHMLMIILYSILELLIKGCVSCEYWVNEKMNISLIFSFVSSIGSWWVP